MSVTITGKNPIVLKVKFHEQLFLHSYTTKNLLILTLFILTYTRFHKDHYALGFSVRDDTRNPHESRPTTGNTKRPPTPAHLVQILGQLLSTFDTHKFVNFYLFIRYFWCSKTWKQKRVLRSSLRRWMDLSRVFCPFLARELIRYHCFCEWEPFELYLKVLRWHLWDMLNLIIWFLVWYVIFWH